MKVQPLNQTALQVSWSQPETIYHPPIINYMISYSWTKNEDEKEKTFTKDSDKDLVKVGVPAPLAVWRGVPTTSLCQALQADFLSPQRHAATALPPCRGPRRALWPSLPGPPPPSHLLAIATRESWLISL